jgi:hypothetical protein
MSKRHAAFGSVMEELKDRIKSHSMGRLQRGADSGKHPEPQVDEDDAPKGRQGPSERTYGHGLKAVEVDLDGDPDDEMELVGEEHEPKWKKESNKDFNCNACGTVTNSEHSFCGHCGTRKR